MARVCQQDGSRALKTEVAAAYPVGGSRDDASRSRTTTAQPRGPQARALGSLSVQEG
jgi:hypothetical protein